MKKQSVKSSLNTSFQIDLNYQSQNGYHNFNELLPNKNTSNKKRRQSFISQKSFDEIRTKQVEFHKKNKSSLSKALSNQDKQRESILTVPKSSNKQQKQRLSFSVIPLSKQKPRGGIRKNKGNHNTSYQSNNSHQISFYSSKNGNQAKKKQKGSHTINIQSSSLPINRQRDTKTVLDFQYKTSYYSKMKEKTLKESSTSKEQEILSSKQNINPNINSQEMNKVDRMTSQRISQLQSKSDTIDLLKFTIKTKLSKDIISDSPNSLNLLFSSQDKCLQSQYMEEILKVKDIQTNFYIDKITALQNQLNKSRKQRQSIEEQIYTKCKQDNRKNLIEKIRFQQENQLLKRQNQALRAIILKKMNKRITP